MGSILKQQINLQQVSPNSYTIAWHPDWAAGESLHGGHVAACLHHAATTYLTTSPDLIPKVNQPGILKLHIEFLRQCERLPSTITITLLRTGAISSTLQLHLHQNDKLKVLALVTSTNFDKPVGPSAKSDWSLPLPPPLPVPDFKNCISPEKQKPDPNWLSGHLTATDFLSFSNRVTFLYPRAGYPVHGVCDNWYGFTDHSSDSSSASSEENVAPKKKEKIDSTYLALMADTIPSMSDTLLRNGGLYDAGHRYKQMKEWDERNPGKRYEMSASLLEAMTRSDTYISTVTLDVEYKRRVDESQGLDWMFSRSTTKMLRDGRMDIEVVMCDERMEVVAVAQHLSLVLEAGRKFAKGGGKKKNNTSKGETKAML